MLVRYSRAICICLRIRLSFLMAYEECNDISGCHVKESNEATYVCDGSILKNSSAISVWPLAA